MEQSILDVLIKTLEENKAKITRAREDARSQRNDAALYEMAVVIRAINETLLQVLKDLAQAKKP